MSSVFSAILTKIFNNFPYHANEETDLLVPLSSVRRAKDLDRQLANLRGTRNGFEYVCIRMCCLSRTFTMLLSTSIILMGVVFYTNLIHSFIKIYFEVTSTDRTYPRFMHGVELVVILSMQWSYSSLSRLMKVGRQEVKIRHDGLLHHSTKKKVMLVSASLLSQLTKLVLFSEITTLTRLDKDGVSGVSLLCVAMLALYYVSLYIPPRTFQPHHIVLFPVLATLHDTNVHALLHVIIGCFALALSMFVVDRTSSHTLLFWVTVLFVGNQGKMVYLACTYNHDTNRAHAQDENVAVSTAVTQIYALILIMRLDSIEPGLVAFYDELHAMWF